jgi:hypothetical protein
MKQSDHPSQNDLKAWSAHLRTIRETLYAALTAADKEDPKEKENLRHWALFNAKHTAEILSDEIEHHITPDRDEATCRKDDAEILQAEEELMRQLREIRKRRHINKGTI